MLKTLKFYRDLSDYQKAILKSGKLDDRQPVGKWLEVLEPLVLLSDKLPAALKTLNILLIAYGSSFLLSGLFYMAILGGWGEVNYQALAMLVLHALLLPFCIVVLLFRRKVILIELDQKLEWCVLPFLQRIHQDVPHQEVRLRMEVARGSLEKELKSKLLYGSDNEMEPLELNWLTIELALGGGTLLIRVIDHLTGSMEVVKREVGDTNIFINVTHFDNTRNLSIAFVLPPGGSFPQQLPEHTRSVTRDGRQVLIYEWEKTRQEASPELFSTDLEKGVKAVLTGQPPESPAARFLKAFSY